MDNDFKDVPLSESNVSLKLAEIQKRCSDLLQEPAALDALTLEGEELSLVPDVEGADPYNNG